MEFLNDVSVNFDVTSDANEFASNFDLFDFSELDDSVLLSATQLVEQQENAENDNFSDIDENTLVSATQAAETIATDPNARYCEDISDADEDTLIAATQAAEQQAENDCKHSRFSWKTDEDIEKMGSKR